MILGFTGPRTGMSQPQKIWLQELFDDQIPPDEFHHGACIGSDATAHWTAFYSDIPLIVVHPPINTKFMMALNRHSRIKVLPAKGYHDRDRDIVDVCDRLASTPAGPPPPPGVPSGTWFTINYALSQHKPITLCYPNGEVDDL